MNHTFHAKFGNPINLRLPMSDAEEDSTAFSMSVMRDGDANGSNYDETNAEAIAVPGTWAEPTPGKIGRRWSGDNMAPLEVNLPAAFFASGCRGFWISFHGKTSNENSAYRVELSDLDIENGEARVNGWFGQPQKSFRLLNGSQHSVTTGANSAKLLAAYDITDADPTSIHVTLPSGSVEADPPGWREGVYLLTEAGPILQIIEQFDTGVYSVIRVFDTGSVHVGSGEALIDYIPDGATLNRIAFDSTAGWVGNMTLSFSGEQIRVANISNGCAAVTRGYNSTTPATVVNGSSMADTDLDSSTNGEWRIDRFLPAGTSPVKGELYARFDPDSCSYEIVRATSEGDNASINVDRAYRGTQSVGNQYGQVWQQLLQVAGADPEANGAFITNKLTVNQVSFSPDPQNATSITLYDASTLAPGDILRRGVEIMRVTAVASNTITVQRGYLGTSHSTLSNNATLLQIIQMTTFAGSFRGTLEKVTTCTTTDTTTAVTNPVTVADRASMTAATVVGSPSESTFQVHTPVDFATGFFDRAWLGIEDGAGRFQWRRISTHTRIDGVTAEFEFTGGASDPDGPFAVAPSAGNHVMVTGRG